MAGFDLASILNDAQVGAGIFANLAVKTTENTKAQDDLTQIMVGEANNAKAAAEDIARTQGQAKLATQQANLKLANTMGTNVQDSGYLIGDMGRRIIAADKEAQQTLEVIKSKQSMSFIDNPLGYMYAQATVGDDVATYNSAVRASELAKDTASKLENLSQAGFATQNAIEQSVNESVIQQNAILQGYKYGKDAHDVALSGLRSNLQGMQASAQASAAAVDMKFKGYAADMQNKAYQVSLAHLDLSRKQFDLASEAKKQKMDEDSLVGKFITKGYFNMSGQELDPVRGKEMIALYKAGQPEVRNLFNSGMQSYMISADGKQSVISTSPYDAATAYGSGMVQNLPQAQKDVGDWLVGKRREFNNPAIQTKLGIDPKDKTGQERAFNEYIRNETNIAGKQGTGIYAPASLLTVTKANPNMAALPVWKEVLAPMAAAGAKLDNPNLVFGAVIDAVKKGTIPMNEAVKLSTLYRSGVDTNNMARNWISTGLPLGTGYSVPTDLGTIDITNDVAFSTYLNKAAVMSKPGFSRFNQRLIN